MQIHINVISLKMTLRIFVWRFHPPTAIKAIVEQQGSERATGKNQKHRAKER
jgi:hypothetical protein